MRFPGGPDWTVDQLLDAVQTRAAHLKQQGVQAGDFVLVWLPSGPDMMVAWFALNYLGAIFVPLNIDYRGNLLAHAINETRAKRLIAHANLLERLQGLELHTLETILYCGSEPEAETGYQLNSFDSPVDAPFTEPHPVKAHDTQTVIFTSGTTGPSKGVLCPYRQILLTGIATYGYLNEQDTVMIELPMFHIGGVGAVIGALHAGATLVIFDGFRTQDFWERVNTFNITSSSGLIGSMAAFLLQAEPSPNDKNNSLRMLTMMLNPQAIEAAERFGFDYVSGFNMTELSVPLITEPNCKVPGSLGTPRDGVECRVVDDNDQPVSPGETGELIVRANAPFALNKGYLNRPDETEEAWRGDWFHTGDLVRQDENGNYYYVDRKKDAIRRRGENISSVEVEQVALGYPGVREVAAVGVDSPHGEQDVLLAVCAEGDIDFAELTAFCIPRMPHYMVPRYFRLLEELPKTPTNKIKKQALRAEGVTADTYDREAHGLKVSRTRL